MSNQQELKKVVEAASNGAQTVLFTKTGQPTFVNIIKKFNIEDVYPALSAAGISGVHPAFKVGASVLDKIYVGTYPTSLVNGELVSQPWMTPTGFSVLQLTTPALVQQYMTATGLNAHGCTTAEASALRSLAIKAEYSPRGNDGLGASASDLTQKGIRVDGLAVGSADTITNIATGSSRSAALITGSSPTSFRTGNTPEGVAELGQVYSGTTYGVRIVKGEVQVYGNPFDKNQADANYGSFKATFASQADFMSGWNAIDATTGALISPTYTGSFSYNGSTGKDTGNYVMTTANSVKVTENTTNLVTGFHNIRNLATEGNLPAIVINKLRYLGLIKETAALLPSAPRFSTYTQLATMDLIVPSFGQQGIFDIRLDSTTLTGNPRMFYYDS